MGKIGMNVAGLSISAFFFGSYMENIVAGNLEPSIVALALIFCGLIIYNVYRIGEKQNVTK